MADPPPRVYLPSLRAKRFRTVGAPKGSRRRMSAGRRMWYALLVALARVSLRLLWASCRVTVVKGREHLAGLNGAPAIVVYWHQMQVFAAWLLLGEAKRGTPLAVLTSPSVSGEVPAAMIEGWGMRPVRGSSTRSAAEALRDMYTVVAKDRQSLVVTADGPKGPLHEFKPGAILLAKMAKAPIVPIAWAGTRVKRWRSWDRFMLPKPFSRIAIVVGEPWTVPAGFAMDRLPATARELGERLQALSAEAETLLTQEGRQAPTDSQGNQGGLR
jgi:lysophospholipid acyltransferase (LPLAT)-like uncharacterized protein